MSKDKPKKTIGSIQVSREEFLKAKPVRNADLLWEKNRKGIAVKIPRKQTLVSRFLSSKRDAKVQLDEQGAFIWTLCDGEHKIKDIAKKLSEQYNMRVPDAENALDLYFVHLSKNGLVGFVLPDQATKRYHRIVQNTEHSDEKNRNTLTFS